MRPYRCPDSPDGKPGPIVDLDRLILLDLHLPAVQVNHQVWIEGVVDLEVDTDGKKLPLRRCLWSADAFVAVRDGVGGGAEVLWGAAAIARGREVYDELDRAWRRHHVLRAEPDPGGVLYVPEELTWWTDANTRVCEANGMTVKRGRPA